MEPAEEINVTTQAATDWIESSGGPLILLSEGIAGQWQGNLLPPHDPISGDYARAVAIKDYVGVIPVGKGSGLVLGGDPLPAKMLATESGLVIVRWIYADSEEVADSIIRDWRDLRYKQETFLFEHSGEAIVLMDSAFPGDNPPESLRLRLDAGTFAVATSEHRPNDHTFFLLHRLERS